MEVKSIAYQKQVTKKASTPKSPTRSFSVSSSLSVNLKHHSSFYLKKKIVGDFCTKMTNFIIFHKDMQTLTLSLDKSKALSILLTHSGLYGS